MADRSGATKELASGVMPRSAKVSVSAWPQQRQAAPREAASTPTADRAGAGFDRE